MDRQTFDRLVIQHLPAAQRFAVRLTGRVDSAEDIVQTALLNAHRNWAGFAGRSSFRTWLFQIIVNAFRDDRSKRPVESVEADVIDRTAIDPSTSAQSAELGRAVAAAVSNLPPRQREVLVLHTYEQLSDGEIAAVLGIEPQNVRTTLYLAREKLKQALRRYADIHQSREQSR